MLSAVITVRNRARMVEECIERLMQQNYPSESFEIVVVDDGSTDATPKVIRRFEKHDPSRLKSVRLHERKGPGYARNIGNSHARGEIIVVQDSDDISLPNRLRVISDYFGAHPHVDLFFSGANMVDGNLRHIIYHHARHQDWTRLEKQQDIWHPTMAYRKRILTCDGGPVEYPADLADVDYGFLLRAKAAGVKYGLYDQPLVLYRQHRGQISRRDHALQQKLANEKRTACAPARPQPLSRHHRKKRKRK